MLCNISLLGLMAIAFRCSYKNKNVRGLFIGLFFGYLAFSSTEYYILPPDIIKWILGLIFIIPALVCSILEMIDFVKDTINKFKGETK